MSIISAITHGAATLGGTAYDYLTPGKGSSRVTDWGAGIGQAKPPAPAAPNYGIGTSGSTLTTGGGAPISIPGAATTPIPRLASFDISSAYDKALQAAAAAVNPVYAAELTRFVDQQTQALSEQQQGATAQKSALDVALDRLRQDNATSKERTTQDTTANIADINATQDVTAREQGLNFDATSRALNENLGAGGTADTGLGQQAVQEGQRQYRDMSNEQVRQTDNKVQAANVLMGRTFQDLDTSETRTTEDTGTKKAQVDVDLQNFIKDQQLALDSQKATIEVKKQSDIQAAAAVNEKSQINDWIASLRGQGYSPQEIALAAQVYG